MGDEWRGRTGPLRAKGSLKVALPGIPIVAQVNSYFARPAGSGHGRHLALLTVFT